MKHAVWHFFLTHWRLWAVPAATLLLTLLSGWILKRSLFRALERHASATKTDLDNILVRALSGPFMIWVLILGVHLSIQTSQVPPTAARYSGKVLLVLWVVSLTMSGTRFVGDLIRHYGNRLEGTLPVTSLTENLARIAVASMGGLFLLRALGIEITPVLAALGVGGLAVALALQDTLSNLFAGVYVSLAGHVKTGDYIKLDSGDEGYVADITWRSTTIRALPNNMIIIPNAKLAQATVTNYHLPDKRMAVLIPVGVSYDCEPERVEEILTEEATAGAEHIPGLLSEPAPFVRFIPGFGDSSLNFTLICQVKEFTDQYLVQHELRKRIFRRFRREGIEIPFPVRTVYIRGESSGGPG